MDKCRIGFGDVLRKRNFGLLWSGQVISNFGDRFNYMAVLGLILFKWEGSALDAGMMFVFMSLPAIMFGPIAGVFVDRYDKRKVMILCDVARCVLVGAMPFVTSMLQVYGLIFCVSAISRFFYPARSAVIPLIVERKELLVANSLSQSTYQVSAVAGYALGGALVGILGPIAVFYLDSVSYVVSAALIFLVRPRSSEYSQDECGGSALGKIRREFSEGLSFTYSEKRLLYVTVLFSFILLAFGGINILWFIIVRDNLGLGVGGIGILESMFGAGMLAGTLIVGYVGHRYRNRSMLVGGVFVTALSFLAIGLHASLYLLSGAVLVAGVAIQFIDIPAVTILQKATPEKMMGRVFSVFGTLVETAGLISMGLIGILADLMAATDLLVVLSIFLLAVGIGGYLVKVDLECGEETSVPAALPSAESIEQ